MTLKLGENDDEAKQCDSAAHSEFGCLTHCNGGDHDGPGRKDGMVAATNWEAGCLKFQGLKIHFQFKNHC